MRDDVVQLACDAQPLFLGGLLALLLVARHDLAEEALARADVVADHPGHEAEGADRKQHAGGLKSARHQQETDGGQDDGDRATGEHQAKAGTVVHGHRIRREGQGEAGRLAIRTDEKRRGFNADHDEEDRDRMVSAPPESGRLQDDCRDQ